MSGDICCTRGIALHLASASPVYIIAAQLVSHTLVSPSSAVVTHIHTNTDMIAQLLHAHSMSVLCAMASASAAHLTLHCRSQDMAACSRHIRSFTTGCSPAGIPGFQMLTVPQPGPAVAGCLPCCCDSHTAAAPAAGTAAVCHVHP